MCPYRTSFLPSCSEQGWGRDQHDFPGCSRTAGASGHPRAGILLFLGGYESSIFLSSKICPYFAESWSSHPRPEHRTGLWQTDVTFTAGKFLQWPGATNGEHPQLKGHQLRPWLICISLPSHRVSPGCEVSQTIGETLAQFSEPGVAGRQVCRSEPGSAGLQPTLAT